MSGAIKLIIQNRKRQSEITEALRIMNGLDIRNNLPVLDKNRDEKFAEFCLKIVNNTNALNALRWTHKNRIPIYVTDEKTMIGFGGSGVSMCYKDNPNDIYKFLMNE